MFSWNNKNQFIKVIKKRVDEIIVQVEKWATKNFYLANLWGIVHITLGLLTIFFSTASTILAFNNNTQLVALLTFIASILASFLTFLNPAKRETRRRIAYQKFLELENKFKNFKLEINSSRLNESETINPLNVLTAEFSFIVKNLLQSID